MFKGGSLLPSFGSDSDSDSDSDDLMGGGRAKTPPGPTAAPGRMAAIPAPASEAPAPGPELPPGMAKAATSGGGGGGTGKTKGKKGGYDLQSHLAKLKRKYEGDDDDNDDDGGEGGDPSQDLTSGVEPAPKRQKVVGQKKGASLLDLLPKAAGEGAAVVRKGADSKKGASISAANNDDGYDASGVELGGGDKDGGEGGGAYVPPKRARVAGGANPNMPTMAASSMLLPPQLAAKMAPAAATVATAAPVGAGEAGYEDDDGEDEGVTGAYPEVTGAYPPTADDPHGPPQDAQTRNNPAVTGFYGYVAPSTGPKMDVSNLTSLPQEFAKHIPRRERANLERNFVDLDVAAQGVGDTWDAETAPKITRTTLYEGTARDRRYGHLQGLLDQHKVNKTMLEQRKQAGLQTKKQTWGKYGWI